MIPLSADGCDIQAIRIRLIVLDEGRYKFGVNDMRLIQLKGETNQEGKVRAHRLAALAVEKHMVAKKDTRQG